MGCYLLSAFIYLDEVEKKSNHNKDRVEISVVLCNSRDRATDRESDVARRKMKMVANIFPEGKGKDIEIAHFLA